MNSTCDYNKFEILKDTERNRQLLQTGFYTIPNFITAADVAFFNDLYKKWHPADPQGFFRSFFSSDTDYRADVEQKIMAILQPILEQHFLNYSCSGAMYIVKPSGENQDIGVHQDWSFVDETKYWSLNMWLPLVDVAQHNGALTIVKGSHKFLDTYRGSGTPEVYSHLLGNVADKYLEMLPMQAGDAVFFFHNLLHGSTYNSMPKARVCVGVSLIQKDAPVIFYRKKADEETTDVFAADPEFYIRFMHHNHEIPAGAQLLEKKKIIYDRLSEEEFIAKAEGAK